jgi:hypothetical protein
VMPAVARFAESMELDMRAWIREYKRRTLDMAPRSRRRSAFHPQHCPAGATHRSNGRDVDVDAGQGNVLQGSNHRTSGWLTVSSKRDSTQVQSTITQESTMTYVTKSDRYRRQAPACQPHVLAWHAFAVIPGVLLADSCFRPLAIPGPGSTTLRTRSVTERTLHATHSGCNLTVRSFMPDSPP